ncbi:hypothetical protein CBOM_07857 [Ceraceosorus bombacis]|uniref:Uncharacterized protein n=1 Tax=Ceraceosorus bombacis TaxID=401625 RepID=A0A0P1BNB1_9BASI|nr:hypothetical protein CBOM_07857 [Ceraceosorus bombacis]
MLSSIHTPICIRTTTFDADQSKPLFQGTLSTTHAFPAQTNPLSKLVSRVYPSRPSRISSATLECYITSV